MLEANVALHPGSRPDFRSVDVVLDGTTEMTPESAIAARDIAFGVSARAMVRGGGRVYLITGTGENSQAHLQACPECPVAHTVWEFSRKKASWAELRELAREPDEGE